MPSSPRCSTAPFAANCWNLPFSRREYPPMPVSNPFVFLKAEWPEVFQAATRAAGLAIPDPRTSCFYARRALELAVNWVYTVDASLLVPYQDNLSALIHEPS